MTCKGCVAQALTIDLLRSQLDREKLRADRYESLLFGLAGIQNESLDTEKEFKPIHGKLRWSGLRRKLENADRKKAKELEDILTPVPEGQEV